MSPRSEREWRLRIEDILAAIVKIQAYTEGMSLDEFRSTPMTIDAVLHNLMIIGKASRYVPADIQQRYPGVDWPRMRGMRNVVVHEYFGARLETVWQTVREDLPALLPHLRAVLASTD